MNADMNAIAKKIVQYSLKLLAKVYMMKTKPYVVIIAGTTRRGWMKEAVVEAFAQRNIKVRANKKHFNAEIGLPLSVLGLSSGEGNVKEWMRVLWKGAKRAFDFRKKALVNEKTEYLVLEMAIDSPDDMRYLLGIVHPDMVIMTTVTMIYQENFETLDNIAKEYEALAAALPWNGILVLNADDVRIMALAKAFDGKKVTYGFAEGAQFRAIESQRVADGEEFKFEVKRKELETYTKHVPRFGRHHIYAELVREIVLDNFKSQPKEFFNKVARGLEAPRKGR